MSGAYVYVRRSLGAVEIRVWNKTSWFLKGHTPDGFTSLCTVRPLDCRYFFRFTTPPGDVGAIMYTPLELRTHHPRSLLNYLHTLLQWTATCILFMPILSH